MAGRAGRRWVPTSQSVFTQATWSRTQPRAHGSLSPSPSSRQPDGPVAHPDGVQTDQPCGGHRPRQVVGLRHHHHPLHAEHVPGPDAGVVGVQAAGVEDEAVARDARREQVVAHGRRLVVLGSSRIPAQQQPVDGAALEEQQRQVQSGAQEPRRHPAGIDLGAEDQSHRRVRHLVQRVEMTGGRAADDPDRGAEDTGDAERPGAERGGRDGPGGRHPMSLVIASRARSFPPATRLSVVAASMAT